MEWSAQHKFYGSAMKVWDRYHGFEPSNEREVRAEWIWQNKRILNGGEPIQQRLDWERAGIKKISHICHRENGVFPKKPFKFQIPIWTV